jgi:hypothetical protein
MARMKTILDVAFALEESGFQLPAAESFKVGHVVEMLKVVASSDQVVVLHDDDPELNELSTAFLEAQVDDAGNGRFFKERARVVQLAKTVLPLFNRVLSEEDIDEIEEDRSYLGLPSQR